MDTVIDNNEMSYSIYRIRKKSGGYRIIHAPSERLKGKQQLILERLYTLNFPVHERSFAFVPRKSMQSIMAYHVQNSAGVSVDICDFFGNCSYEKFVDALNKKNIPFDIELMEDVKRFCFVPAVVDFKEKLTDIKMLQQANNETMLPQGGVTSPFISNIILSDVDEKLNLIFSNFYEASYTRYADDICVTFNSDCDGIERKFSEVIGVIYACLLKEHFSLNPRKTHKWTERHSTKICGMVLTPGKWLVTGSEDQNKYGRVSTSRRKRKFVGARLHKMIQDIQAGRVPPKFYINKDGLVMPINLNKISGHIAWMASVNKEQCSKLKEQLNLLKEICYGR